MITAKKLQITYNYLEKKIIQEQNKLLSISACD